MEILVLENITTESKISLDGFNSRLNLIKQKKELRSFKTNHLKLSSQRNK